MIPRGLLITRKGSVSASPFPLFRVLRNFRLVNRTHKSRSMGFALPKAVFAFDAAVAAHIEFVSIGHLLPQNDFLTLHEGGSSRGAACSITASMLPDTKRFRNLRETLLQETNSKQMTTEKRPLVKKAIRPPAPAARPTDHPHLNRPAPDRAPDEIAFFPTAIPYRRRKGRIP
ncbi:hypothetical protein EVAR_74566_1 [Eumeta japonica]|uniref:Uncharacterized protein n=1 Tax=Eumeta variegata TaxID=151549 RepID=A0A4C1TES3_EUMVA|nr:hypothetical protein EVAR_74566_1 [Eumeta japonica]